MLIFFTLLYNYTLPKISHYKAFVNLTYILRLDLMIKIYAGWHLKPSKDQSLQK